MCLVAGSTGRHVGSVYAAVCRAVQIATAARAAPWYGVLAGTRLHLHFPAEIVRQHGREAVDLVTGLEARRDVVHLRLRLGKEKVPE